MAKTKGENYRKVLCAFKQLARKHGVALEPQVITCDFEEAQAEALRSEFPAAALQGCGFHHKRAIHRNWRKRVQQAEVESRLGFRWGNMVPNGEQP